MTPVELESIFPQYADLAGDVIGEELSLVRLPNLGVLVVEDSPRRVWVRALHRHSLRADK